MSLLHGRRWVVIEPDIEVPVATTASMLPSLPVCAGCVNESLGNPFPPGLVAHTCSLRHPAFRPGGPS